jgi:NADH-quinone oxidoreductase subunit C
MTDETKSTLVERLSGVVGGTGAPSSDGIPSVGVVPGAWLDAARAIDRAGFTRFIDLTAIDRVGTPQAEGGRFEVHLLVYSMTEHAWARLLTRTDDKLASVFSVFPAVHNYEREVFDLFGVVFEGHPRLTRLMLPDGWQGHPLRRDEPLVLEPTDFTVTRELYKT